MGCDQTVPTQNAMNGVPRQLQTFARQQHLQLARAPVGITEPQLRHLSFHIAARAAWTVVRFTAALCDSLYALFPVPL
jgi:hypothetical protein